MPGAAPDEWTRKLRNNVKPQTWVIYLISVKFLKYCLSAHLVPQTCMLQKEWDFKELENHSYIDKYFKLRP